MFEPFLKTRLKTTYNDKCVYRLDCQCLSEIEYAIMELDTRYSVQTTYYPDVEIPDMNYSQFVYDDIFYTISIYKQNRNVKFVSLESKPYYSNTVTSSESSISSYSISDNEQSDNGQSNNVQCSTSETSIPDETPITALLTNYSLENTSESESESTNQSITDIINGMYSNKSITSTQYNIAKKLFSGDHFNIAVYSIYQNEYLLKTFVLFDNVSLFKYFYKEPFLYDTFQSIIGNYNYLNVEYLEKDKMYYFYKINHLERYAIKLYVYQLNQGKWCSWNAETNIILGLDLSRPFYVIQLLESIDNREEQIFIDLLNRSCSTIDERVMFVQNIFGKEFIYPRQNVSMNPNDQGIILEISNGLMRQFLW